ncbi:MAG: D-alanine--D-alanine ligase [Verrucomicrobiales bacterium]
MKLKGKTITIAMGGPGSEREISLASARSVRAALEEVGDIEIMDLDVRGPDFEVRPETDLIYNLIHGTFGEDGRIQEILESRGLAYTGAGVESSRIAFDKFQSKERFVEAGVPTPAWEILDLSKTREPLMKFPLVVKPAREGSSVGVHLVRTADEWADALADASRFGDRLLVEELIEGKELTVGILDNHPFPIVHIQPRSGFYDMKNKYPWLSDEGGTDYFCPADLDVDTTRAIQEAALAAHRSLGIEIYSSVDLLLEGDGTAFVLEVNTIPGMTASSLLPKGAAAEGIDFGELCVRIAELSLDLRES